MYEKVNASKLANMPLGVEHTGKWSLKAVLGLVLVLGLVGCNRSSTSTPGTSTTEVAAAPTATEEPLGFSFTDVTKEAKISFRQNNGAFGAAFLPETYGSGAAWFDYDNDGDADLFFVNGRDWTPKEVNAYDKAPVTPREKEFMAQNSGNTLMIKPRDAKPQSRKRTVGALYRNNGDGTFSDVTKGSGLDIEMQGMGASAADYDADGLTDLCITSYGRLFLFHNRGGGKFQDVSKQMGVEDSAWSTSAAWFDYDRDGWLDLFVCRYLWWEPQIDRFISIDKHNKSYGWPKDYPSQSCLLFHNIGGKRFENVSEKSGIATNLKTKKPNLGAALGVLVCDPNHDGWPDLVVANDLRPNFLFINQHNGTFSEEALKRGIATGNSGNPRGGMGIDSADIDHSGNDSIAIGHFNADIMGLWQGSKEGTFHDIADKTEVGPSSATFLTFGLLFSDLNNDGWPDLLAANGHFDPTVHNFLILVTYEERPLLFLNTTATQGAAGTPKFHEIAEDVGLKEAIVARGLCVADYDLDGDLDVLMTTTAGTPRLWRNDNTTKNESVRLVLKGKAPNLAAIGAHVEARIGQQVLRRDVRTGSSYLSQNELPLTLGTGKAHKIDSLSIRWPDGTQTQLKDVATNQMLTIDQPKGIIEKKALRKADNNAP